ncbi:hypothetical protein Mal48_17370 [Thalassoglobus polymorphus]|uniref:Uncharacterized protein n=1 Tax=Thalassoglobus polymorphus TaxID=2527994 RepID=A0A517QLK8_9PLAN|nr:hypothetical protein Mal48_17370 [Thalassoglobus polymorphus]
MPTVMSGPASLLITAYLSALRRYRVPCRSRRDRSTTSCDAYSNFVDFADGFGDEFASEFRTTPFFTGTLITKPAN